MILAGGVAAGAMIIPVSAPPSMLADTAALTLPVQANDFSDSRLISVLPELTTGVEISVRTTGTLTRSECATGAIFESGTSPITVDDRRILAIHTSSPLWRNLDVGSKGDDVSALQTELRRLGYEVADDGSYGRSTESAVKKLQAAVGALPVDGTLFLDRVLWLPTNQVVLSQCVVPLAGLVAEGEPLFEGEGSLKSLAIGSRESVAGSVGYVLRAEDAQTAVPVTGLIIDPEFLRAVQVSPEFISWQRNEGKLDLALKFELAEPITVAILSPMALFGIAESHACVSVNGEPEPVTIVSSELGKTLVTFDVLAEIPQQVDLLTPPVELSCR